MNARAKRVSESDFDRLVMVRLVDARVDVGCFVVHLKDAMRYLPGTITEAQAKRQFMRAIGAA